MDIKIIKSKALEAKIPIIMDDTLEVITEILKEFAPNKILEIGTAVGYSAICFSKYLKENGKIDTIEKDEKRAIEAKDNIKSLNLQNKINVLTGDALEILPTVTEKYDIVFIDAAKGKYTFFLEEALKRVKVGGIIFADNVLFKGYVLGEYNKHKHRTAVNNLRKFISEITTSPNLDTKILDVGDGLAIIKVIKE